MCAQILYLSVRFNLFFAIQTHIHIIYSVYIYIHIYKYDFYTVDFSRWFYLDNSYFPVPSWFTQQVFRRDIWVSFRGATGVKKVARRSWHPWKAPNMAIFWISMWMIQDGTSPIWFPFNLASFPMTAPALSMGTLTVHKQLKGLTWIHQFAEKWPAAGLAKSVFISFKPMLNDRNDDYFRPTWYNFPPLSSM